MFLILCSVTAQWCTVSAFVWFKMKLIVYLVVATLYRANAFGINTVTSLNVTKYLGRWYQLYADRLVLDTFERDAVCVTADYTLLKDGKIGVLNSERVKSETGDQKTITGYVYIPDPDEPGKLIVHLEGTPADAPYWVVKLGPETYSDQGLYQYAVVTDPFQLMLYVLVRDVETFKSQFDEQVLGWLADNGFTLFYNKPVLVVQNKRCLYPAIRASPYQTLLEMLD